MAPHFTNASNLAQKCLYFFPQGNSKADLEMVAKHGPKREFKVPEGTCTTKTTWNCEASLLGIGGLCQNKALLINL